MKLIDKSAVVAEIKELSSAIKIQLDYKKGDAFWIAQKLLLERLKGKIDFLEVKEVDLEKEIDNYLLTYWNEEREKFLHPFLKKMCVHFFELGIIASNKV